RSSSNATTPQHYIHSFPTRRSSDLTQITRLRTSNMATSLCPHWADSTTRSPRESEPSSSIRSRSSSTRTWAAITVTHAATMKLRSEEHTSELQSLRHLVCRLLLEKK